MTRFFKNYLYFFLPIIILWIVKLLVYETSGDLGRLGKIPISSSYRMSFSELEPKRKSYSDLSNFFISDSSKVKVLVIGDSFSSGQGLAGYVNILAADKNLQVVLFDEYLRNVLDENPIKNLSDLINGGFFDSIPFDYVILQNVERYVVERAVINIDSGKLSVVELNGIALQKDSTKYSSLEDYISNELTDMVLFYQFGIGYLLDDNAFNSDVYQIPIEDKMFTHFGDLLVYKDDLERIEKFDKEGIVKMNEVLNQLSQRLATKEVTLISLISPDKFDMYYDSLISRNDYKKPIFFDTYRNLQKQYVCIDAYEILKHASKKGVRDLYYYEDSHWSIIGHKIIAEKLIIKLNPEAHHSR